MGAAERKTLRNFRCGGGDGEATEICSAWRGGGLRVRTDQVQAVLGVEGAKPPAAHFVEVVLRSIPLSKKRIVLLVGDVNSDEKKGA